MSQWILESNGKVVARRTVHPLNNEAIHSPEEQIQHKLFDKFIQTVRGQSLTDKGEPSTKNELSSEEEEEEEEEWEPYYDAEEMVKEVPDVEDCVDIHGRVINQQPMYDQMLSLEIQMENGTKRKVSKRVVAPDRRQLGTYNEHPALNTIMYEVEFDDGQV